MVKRFRNIKKHRTLADVHNATRYRNWFYKQYPIEFKEPQLTCGKSWIPFNIYLNYQLMGLKIGAFKYKQSNREKKKRQQVLEQYKNWENKFKEYYEKPNQQTI